MPNDPNTINVINKTNKPNKQYFENIIDNVPSVELEAGISQA